MTLPSRNALAIELTPYCNQRCGYCYNAFRAEPSALGTLPPAELLALVDRALGEVAFDHVTLTGGEPFAWPHVFEMLDVVRAHDLRALIISNGGLVTRALAARLAPYRPIVVQVTLNGPDAEVHEAQSGPGCFEATLAGIRALVAAGVAVAGSIVITRKNASRVGETLDLFRALGVTSVALSRYSPAGYAAEQIAELLPARRDVLAALEAGEGRAAANGLHLQATMPVPPCVVDHADYPHVTFSSCPIGTDAQELALGADGKLRHCTLHADVLGDARTTSVAEIATAKATLAYRDVTPEFCAPCPHKSSCLGGCGAAAATVFGDARGLDPFVAQHVDPAFAARLRGARGGAAGLVALGRGPRAAEERTS